MARRQNGKMPRRFPLSMLVTVLFAVLAVTSGMVGYVLGRNAPRFTGELVDTIVLSPGTSAQSRETVHYLSGRLCHSSGEPFSGATVQLKDTGHTDVTDEQGKFYFSGLRAGTHRLEVKNNAGKTVTDMELTLDFSGEVSAEFGKGYTSFRMTEDARMLEFTITVDDSDLTVDEDSAYFVTKDGTIVDFSGSSLTVQKPAVAILPNVDVVSPEGHVLLPSKGTVVTPQGSEVDVAVGEEVLPGVTVEEDGSVHIGGSKEGESSGTGGDEIADDGIADDEIVVMPDGEITLPDGNTAEVGDDVIVAGDGEIEEVPELPDDFPPVESVPEQDPADPDDSPAEDAPVIGAPETDEPPANDPETDDPAPGDPGKEESSEPERSYQGLSVIDVDTGISWKQQSTIDLFKHRTKGGVAKSAEEQPVAPGSSGYYEFRLKNPEDFDIAYTISIEELSFHLPIRYSVLNAATKYSYLYRERISSPEEPLVSQELVIPAGGEQTFRIEWDWMFEDWYNRALDNSLDIAAAKDGRTYMLAVMLNAAEVLKAPEEPEVSYDGELRYPGKR